MVNLPWEEPSIIHSQSLVLDPQKAFIKNLLNSTNFYKSKEAQIREWNWNSSAKNQGSRETT